MCGIMGYVGRRSAIQVLTQGLKQLEYRGYDSAGVALFYENHTWLFKAEGRFDQTVKLLEKAPSHLAKATFGIGHTRWATHGGPSTLNAHPHQVGHVTLVHNGIIENYLELRKDILSRGYQPLSETDSELFAYLVWDAMENQHLSLREAVRTQFLNLKGQSSVVVISEKESGTLIGCRRGSPLVVARDPEGGGLIASDARPLLSYQRNVIYLQHEDLVEIKNENLNIYSVQTGKEVSRPEVYLDWSEEKLELGAFEHYMLKEIYEQPQALLETLNGVLNRSHEYAVFDWIRGGELERGLSFLQQAQEMIFIACGTSWHVAWLAKYWIEKWAKIPVSVELASEFRYRFPVVRPGTVVVGVSQSGETADTLAALHEMRKQGVPTLGISNVRGSSISKETDALFYTAAGLEVGVASTKAFFAQMGMVLLWAGHLSGYRLAQPWEERKKLFDHLLQIPHLLSLQLERGSDLCQQVKEIANALPQVKGFFFIGRGYCYPMALEGALKLKEISYEHAEGYPAGELKHGPLAMIDTNMVVVVLCPRDFWRDKTFSNLQEVKARGAQVIGIGSAEDEDLKRLCHYWIPLPPFEKEGMHPDLSPFFIAPILQLFSYYRGVLGGHDVDKPRNLAKSVTVE